MKRRRLLRWLGGTSLASGVALGSGAFSNVEAPRGTEIDVVGDTDAYLELGYPEQSVDFSCETTIPITIGNQTTEQLDALSVSFGTTGDVRITDLSAPDEFSVDRSQERIDRSDGSIGTGDQVNLTVTLRCDGGGSSTLSFDVLAEGDDVSIETDPAREIDVSSCTGCCTSCESGESLLVKYKWDETNGEFTTEGSDPNVSLGNVSLDTEDEPNEACFTTDYCNVDAVVKAGTKYEKYKDQSGSFCVTGIEYENAGGQTTTHAISNVRFFCEAPDDLSVSNS